MKTLIIKQRLIQYLHRFLCFLCIFMADITLNWLFLLLLIAATRHGIAKRRRKIKRGRMRLNLRIFKIISFFHLPVSYALYIKVILKILIKKGKIVTN